MSDAFERRLFRQLDDRLAALADEPTAGLVDGARLALQQLLLTVDPDGSWPDPELLREATTMCIEVVEQLLGDRGTDLPPDDRRWMDAGREMVSSPELFADALADLRADIRPLGPQA